MTDSLFQMVGITDGNETDVDCGGMCPKCGPYKRCKNDTDCISFTDVISSTNGSCVGYKPPTLGKCKNTLAPTPAPRGGGAKFSTGSIIAKLPKKYTVCKNKKGCTCADLGEYANWQRDETITSSEWFGCQVDVTPKP